MSARRGFSREIISLVSWILALVLGMWFYGTAAALLHPYISSEQWASLAGFLIVVFGVMICGNLLGWIVSRFVRTIGLSFFDRLLGAAFGAVKGLLISMALLTAFMAFGPVDHGTVNAVVLHSQIAPCVLEASHLAVAIAPNELKTGFLRQYEGVKAALQNKSEGQPQNK